MGYYIHRIVLDHNRSNYMPGFAIPNNAEEFKASVGQIEAGADYQRPAAFALGLATVDFASDEVLDVRYTTRNYGESFGTAAVLAATLGQEETGLQTGQHLLNYDDVHDALDLLGPFKGGGIAHPNVETLDLMGKYLINPRKISYSSTRNSLMPVLGVVANWDDAPRTVADTYLRLYALSERQKRPNSINLDGAFGVLPNVVITEAAGTFTTEAWNDSAEALAFKGVSTAVRVLDKFPRMLDHVMPSGVRVADPSRVRLGAHLGEGTTVMHEGFVNFNAGTLGQAMVEGRISANVVVGDGSDIGGGASIMGTLSGGGTAVISVGENCLLGANSGIGISLGNECVVEAGLYVTAGTKVSFEGSEVKALELSGSSGLLFIRDSLSGAVIAKPREGKKIVLNPALHAN
jgi:2,3,4,5-tetrahydropyridine-2-carboxylate N-succinyltransferase